MTGNEITSGRCGRDFRLVHADQDFCVALDPFVEFLIGFRHIVDRNMVAHDFSGSGLATDDQVSQIFVVPFNWGLTATDRKRLVEYFSDSERNTPFFRELSFFPGSGAR